LTSSTGVWPVRTQDGDRDGDAAHQTGHDRSAAVLPLPHAELSRWTDHRRRGRAARVRGGLRAASALARRRAKAPPRVRRGLERPLAHQPAPDTRQPLRGDDVALEAGAPGRAAARPGADPQRRRLSVPLCVSRVLDSPALVILEEPRVRSPANRHREPCRRPPRRAAACAKLQRDPIQRATRSAAR